MNWAGWAVFGLVATAALTAVMTTAQVAGPGRLGNYRPALTHAAFLQAALALRASA